MWHLKLSMGKTELRSHFHTHPNILPASNDTVIHLVPQARNLGIFLNSQLYIQLLDQILSI